MSDGNDINVSGAAPAKDVKVDVSRHNVDHGEKQNRNITIEPIESIRASNKAADVAIDTSNRTISPEKLSELIKELEEKLPTTASKGLVFRMDPILEKPIVSVIDKESGAVIRQLPPEEVVRAARNIEVMRGILFDDFT